LDFNAVLLVLFEGEADVMAFASVLETVKKGEIYFLPEHGVVVNLNEAAINVRVLLLLGLSGCFIFLSVFFSSLSYGLPLGWIFLLASFKRIIFFFLVVSQLNISFNDVSGEVNFDLEVVFIGIWMVCFFGYRGLIFEVGYYGLLLLGDVRMRLGIYLYLVFH
jgi:hypothetical protein